MRVKNFPDGFHTTGRSAWCFLFVGTWGITTTTKQVRIKHEQKVRDAL